MMNSIPSDFQDELIEFLCKIKPLCDDQENRDALLRDFPLAGDIRRNSAYRTDISVIVRNVFAWGRVTEGEHKGKYFLEILIERVRRHVKGAEHEPYLEDLLKRFASGEDMTEDRTFVNRIDEINQIDSPPVYYLVDAPAGYGKTYLLQELQQRFKRAGWCCAYVSIHSGTVMHTVIENLASRLQVDISNSKTLGYGERLGMAIMQSGEIASRKGVMLLLEGKTGFRFFGT